MERIVESHEFGPHRVDVLEYPDDEGGGHVVVVIDSAVVTEPALSSVPDFEELVRIYAAWQASRASRR